MNIFNSLLAQLVKYDVHTTHKINLIHAIFLSHIIIISVCLSDPSFLTWNEYLSVRSMSTLQYGCGSGVIVAKGDSM